MSLTPIAELDKDKPDFTLVPIGAMEAIAGVRKFGIRKHAQSQLVEDVPEVVWVSKALRHIFAALDGDILDPESGLPHLHHALTDLALAAQADRALRKDGR